MSLASNREYMSAVRSLIDRWRAEGRSRPLERVEPAYSAFNGLTDGWADLRDALADAGQYELPESERAKVRELIDAADRAIARERVRKLHDVPQDQDKHRGEKKDRDGAGEAHAGGGDAVTDLYGWLASARSRWETMTFAQQLSGVGNLLIDLALLAALGYFLRHGLTGDPMGLLFWPPVLAVLLFHRFRQMKERWKA